jgi:hypothetical protein
MEDLRLDRQERERGLQEESTKKLFVININ